MGITARLTISLIAVALLAAAANLIARDSVSIVRMVTRSPLWVASAPANRAISDAKNFDALHLAVDRYDRAVQLRAGSASATVDSDYLAARDALLRSARGYAGAA